MHVKSKIKRFIRKYANASNKHIEVRNYARQDRKGDPLRIK